MFREGVRGNLSPKRDSYPGNHAWRPPRRSYERTEASLGGSTEAPPSVSARRFRDLLFERDPSEMGPIPDGAPGNEQFEERADVRMLGPAPAKPGQGPRPPGSVARGRRPRARWAIARAGELRPRRRRPIVSTPGQWRLPDDGDYQWSRRARGERRGSARQSRRFEGALGTLPNGDAVTRDTKQILEARRPHACACKLRDRLLWLLHSSLTI